MPHDKRHDQLKQPVCQSGSSPIDACTLVSYNVVGRSDLLWQQFDGRAHWTETIQREVGRLGVTGTDWLGAPIEIGGDSVTEIIEVNKIRAALGARPAENATLHLGEAEIIYHLTAHQPGWTFISDDRVAVDFAIRRGLTRCPGAVPIDLDTRRIRRRPVLDGLINEYLRAA
jgi:hypothetical protein